MKPFFVYMLRCVDGSYYIGQTDDLEKRLTEHTDGVRHGYTSKRLPVVLAHSEEFATRDEANLREHQLKRWSRAKKEALIQQKWERLKGLSRPKSRPAIRD